MIHILTPLADGQILDPWCDLSIAGQRTQCIRIPISRPRNDSSCRISEAECRNELKKYASKPYSFLLDSDAYFTSPFDVSDCIEFLNKNTELDAVALDTKSLGSVEKQQKKWVIIAAMCVRYEKLQTITFGPTYETDGRELCCCISVNKNLRIRYLDGRRLGEIK